MNKLSKSIILEIVPIFLLLNFFFIFLMLLEQMIQLANLLFLRNVPSIMVFKIIIYYIPSFLSFTMPISTILATFLAFSRFSGDSELIAMHSIGASKLVMLRPVMIFGVIAACMGIYVSTVLLPKGSKLAVSTINEIIQSVSINDIREKELYDSFEGIVFYANKKIDNNNFENINLINSNNNLIISAKSATIISGEGSTVSMSFNDGTMVMSEDKDRFSVIDFKRSTMDVFFKFDADFLTMSERFMSLSDLKAGFDSDVGRQYSFEYFKRFTFPLSAILMSVLGLFFGSYLQRGGKSFGLVLCCAVVAVYNVLYIINANFTATYPPQLLAILPLLLLLLCTIILLRRYINN